jgi:hypothetical protein
MKTKRVPGVWARSGIGRASLLWLAVNLVGAACSLPPSIASQTRTERPADTATPTPALAPTAGAAATDTAAPTDLATLEPSATPTPALLDLEIVEWSEFPYANPADPANTDTHVEVLIRNPNDVPVRLTREGEELRFLNAAGEVVYANPSPFFYIWQGSWMLPGETYALSACVCFWTGGLEKQEWESLELIAPLQVATDLAYTLDVEFTVGEFFSLADAHLGGSGLGAEVKLVNRSEHVLESVPTLVFARDLNGRYIGMASFGNAVASFTENIGIQPGATASGVVVNDIDYYDDPMTYEARAIGILADLSPTDPPVAPAGTPVADWMGVPIMPGALNGGEAEGGYRFATPASIDEVKSFYEATLVELGYGLSISGEDSGVAYQLFEKDTTTVIIGVLPAADHNLVQITVAP